MGESQPKITDLAFVTEGAVYGPNSMKKKELDKRVAAFIAKDMRPISTVDGEGFRELIKCLDPRYQLPSRQYLSQKLIPEAKDAVRTTLLKDLATANWIAITTDMWSSLTVTSFLAITGHYANSQGDLVSCLIDCSSFHARHTSENITERLQKVLEEYQIQGKIVAAISDNAANMKKAITNAGKSQYRVLLIKYVFTCL